MFYSMTISGTNKAATAFTASDAWQHASAFLSADLDQFDRGQLCAACTFDRPGTIGVNYGETFVFIRVQGHETMNEAIFEAARHELIFS